MCAIGSISSHCFTDRGVVSKLLVDSVIVRFAIAESGSHMQVHCQCLAEMPDVERKAGKGYEFQSVA